MNLEGKLEAFSWFLPWCVRPREREERKERLSVVKWIGVGSLNDIKSWKYGLVHEVWSVECLLEESQGEGGGR